MQLICLFIYFFNTKVDFHSHDVMSTSLSHRAELREWMLHRVQGTCRLCCMACELNVSEEQAGGKRDIKEP